MKPLPKIFEEPIIAGSLSVERLETCTMDASPIRLNYHRILFVRTGEGRLKIDDLTFEVKRKDIFLLAKGQVYQFEVPTIISGYILSFGDCFWEKTPKSASNCKAVLFNNAAANQRLQPGDLELNELASLFDVLCGEYNTSAYTNQADVLAAYLKIIMIKLANIKMTEEGSFDSQDYVLYRKFMELLSAEYRNYHSVNDYATMLHITARRLSDLCRRCSNKSAKEIINGQIIAEAKRALQFSASAIKEIAYELNFNSPEQFSHFFKKIQIYLRRITAVNLSISECGNEILAC